RPLRSSDNIWPPPPRGRCRASNRRFGMLGRTLGLVVLAVCVVTSATVRAAEPPKDVQFTRDVVYGKGGGEDLKLNIARPKNADSKKLPCIVFIHGGGWTGGDRKDVDGATWEAARRGYVAATVGYRLTPKH